MKCPTCHSEVADWHFYCSNCHALVNEYAPNAGKMPEGLVERAGRRVLDVLFGVFIVGLLVLMARAIEWGSLLRAFRDELSSPAETRREGNQQGNSEPSRRLGNSNQNASHNSGNSNHGKDRKAESVRSMPQTIEELPSPKDSPPSGKISPQATSQEPRSIPPPAPSKPTGPTEPIEKGAELGVEGQESGQSVAVGFIAVSSYTPARIYMDGQFSGLTPRTVKLAAGDHQIRLIAEGYEDWTQRVSLKSRQQIGIMATMKKKLSARE